MNLTDYFAPVTRSVAVFRAAKAAVEAARKDFASDPRRAVGREQGRRAADLARLEAEYAAAAVGFAESELASADEFMRILRRGRASGSEPPPDRLPLADPGPPARWVWFAATSDHTEGVEVLTADLMLRLPVTDDAFPWIVGDRVEWVGYSSRESAMSALEHAMRHAHPATSPPPSA